VERERTVSPYQHLPSHHGCSVVAWGQCTPGRTRASGAAPGLGKPILLAQLVEELQDLTQSLEVQSGEIESALSRWERLSLARVGPAHGNGRVGAIGQAQDQVGIHAATDEDDLTSLAPKGMIGMGDGH
jgi:hypothetical protein